MAMTADSSQNQQPAAADIINSPQKRKNFPSAWAQVVRGAEPVLIPPLQHLAPPLLQEQFPFPDCSSPAKASSPPPQQQTENSESTESNNGNAGTPKKPAWRKPSPNGLAAEVVVSPVMGAVSWPALSESTNKASPKSSPPPPDGSSSMPAVPQGPVISQKQAPTNAKSNSTSNHVMPARQRPMKRAGGGGGGSSGGGHSQSTFTHVPQPPPSPPPYPIFAMPPNGYANLVPVVPDQSPRGNSWEPRPVVGAFVPPLPVVNDHRHSSRRGNFGPRGDGSYNNNFGGRRDQDRGHYGNGRDVPAQPQRSPRGFVSPPPQNTAPFVPSQTVRPFANPMGFPDLVYIPALPLEPYRGVPFIAHPPSPVMMPVSEPPLPDILVRQIEYYFSDGNLVKDDFLKSNMDDQGWVPITLIASFNRVRKMTNDIHLVLDSLRTSTFLEVQDDKVRRRNDWTQWIPNSSRLPTDSSQQTLSASNHNLLTTFQTMTVEEVAANQNSTAVSSSSNSEDAAVNSSGLTAESLIPQGEGFEDASSS
ncbi:la-related protein 1C [Ricinus communis]|uniref:la-related protein 1C n=1 Tax=Ricinus communis TaxID=3988 RepID=UPI00201A9CD7|nr:la-related protein 1C [Ricinus communis]